MDKAGLRQWVEQNKQPGEEIIWAGVVRDGNQVSLWGTWYPAAGVGDVPVALLLLPVVRRVLC